MLFAGLRSVCMVKTCSFQIVTDRERRPASTKPRPDHGPDHGPDRGPDRGPDCGPDHGPDHGSDQGKNFKIQD